METKVEFVLPAQQYARLAALAQDQQIPVAELALLAVQEWLDRWTLIEKARRLLHDLGDVADGSAPVTPGDVAMQHDLYLYARDSDEQ